MSSIHGDYRVPPIGAAEDGSNTISANINVMLQSLSSFIAMLQNCAPNSQEAQDIRSELECQSNFIMCFFQNTTPFQNLYNDAFNKNISNSALINDIKAAINVPFNTITPEDFRNGLQMACTVFDNFIGDAWSVNQTGYMWIQGIMNLATSLPCFHDSKGYLIPPQLADANILFQQIKGNYPNNIAECQTLVQAILSLDIKNFYEGANLPNA